MSVSKKTINRTPKELLEAFHKVIKAQKERKKRNPAVIAKVNHGPEQADDFDVRCGGADKVTAGQVKTG